MTKRKQNLGSYNRKAKQRKDQMAKSLAGSISSLFNAIKTYLRSTMSQERLNRLALISIENGYLDKLNFDNLIEEFASKNARRSNFLRVVLIIKYHNRSYIFFF